MLENYENCTKNVISFGKWNQQNQLKINAEKANVMTIGTTKVNTEYFEEYFLSGPKLEKINEINDLGVIIDNRLSFDKHSNYAKNKALKRLNYNIKSNSNLKNPYTLRKLYITLERPIITYGCYMCKVKKS